MNSARVEHPGVDQRVASGREARARCTPESQAEWSTYAGRDPIAALEQQNATRDIDLVPVRHGRMSASPFTFYRGAAKIMADDLGHTPRSGLEVQLCGDAHLSNFGVFASPERTLLFDLNDFDETLPGPFEYDVKRMAASFVIAARNNGFNKSDQAAATLTAIRSYREAMAEFAQMSTLDIWYARRSEAEILAAVGEAERKKGDKHDRKAMKKAAKAAAKQVRKARTRDSLQALSKLAEEVDGTYRIASRPPTVIPARELTALADMSPEQLQDAIHEQFRAYRSTLEANRRQLLERFQIVDVARKVVGVGSVGTRAFIVLLMGRDETDPLFLQVKEATRSVLEGHLPKSAYQQPGERVVRGQRMMQASSDIFLGWTKGVQANRYLYWRQLRDMKGSAEIETMPPVALAFYARQCGWTLARAHARSGDPIAINEYLGDGDAFDRAVARFSARYADQNERDYDDFCAAIESGQLAAVTGV